MDLYPPLPVSIDVEPTIRCNLRCPMCQRTYWNRIAKDLDFCGFKTIINSFPSLKALKLQGMGEPFLNNAIFEMIEYAKNQDIAVSIYSNATLFGQKALLERLASSKLDLLRISIDSGEKLSYEAIRRGAVFEDTINNVRLLVQKNKSIKRIEFWSVLMKPNAEVIHSLVDLAQQCGIYTVNLQLILNTFSYKDTVGETIARMEIPTGETTASLLLAVKEYARQVGVDLEFAYSKAYSPSRRCHWSFDKSFISVEGYVVPCCTIADPTILNFGNIFETPFEDIWYGRKYRVFRQAILEDRLFSPCQYCYSGRHQAMVSSLF